MGIKFPHHVRETFMAELGALRSAVYVTAVSGDSLHREIKLYFWHTNKICIHCKGAINSKCTMSREH